MSLDTGAGRLVGMAVAVVLFAGTAAAADRVALVIGNGAYENVDPLPNPSNDARAISDELAELGFEVLTAIDVSLVEMRDRLDEFGESAHEAEIALIYYAGHGLQVDGQNYLLPVDAEIAARGDLSRQTIPTAEFFDQFVRASPQLAVLILDACRDNPFASAVSTSQGLASGSVSARTFVTGPDAAGMLIAFAAEPGEVAYDGEDGNSPYTTALLQWIDRPGLELATMFRRVRNTVLELTGNNQVPWVEEALLRDVYLNPGPVPPGPSPDERLEVQLLASVERVEDPVEQAAVMELYSRYSDAQFHLAAATLPQRPEPDYDRQGQHWIGIRQSTDPADYERYLETYPDSRFAPHAQRRLAELQRWNEIANSTDPAVLQRFLESFPDGVKAPLVRQRLQEPEDWAQIENSAKPADFEQFLDAYPDGQYASLARARLRDLRETALWFDIADSDDPAKFERFLELFPDGQYASRASERLRSFSVAPAAEAPPAPTEIEAALDLDSEERAAVQLLLQEAGFYRGPIDADFGPGTRGGLRECQDRWDLPATGYLNRPTLQALVTRVAAPVLSRGLAQDRREALHRVAAVAQSGPDAEPVVVQVAAVNRNDAVHAYWRSIADEFEASRPGTRVELNFQPGGQYQARLMSMLGAADPPEILYTWGGGHLDALRDAGFARDLTDEIAEGWAFEFKPVALQNFLEDGRIHGVPTHASLISLYVNSDVLDRAGIAIEQLQSWDGFLAAVRELRSQGITPIAIGGADRYPFQLIYGSLAQRIGGEDAFEAAVEREGDGFLAAAFVEAGDRVAELAALDPFQDGAMAMDDGDAGDLVATGEAAMILTGNWRLSSMRWTWPGGEEGMREALVRIEFPVLGRPVAGLETYGGADGFAVRQGAPDAAVDFLRELVSLRVQQRMTEIATNVPALAAADLAIEDPFLREVSATLTDSEYHQLYLDQVVGPEVAQVVTEAALALGSGEMTGRDAAAAIDRAWDAHLANEVE